MQDQIAKTDLFFETQSLRIWNTQRNALVAALLATALSWIVVSILSHLDRESALDTSIKLDIFSVSVFLRFNLASLFLSIWTFALLAFVVQLASHGKLSRPVFTGNTTLETPIR
jgi:hypothetical protein